MTSPNDRAALAERLGEWARAPHRSIDAGVANGLLGDDLTAAAAALADARSMPAVPDDVRAAADRFFTHGGLTDSYARTLAQYVRSLP